MSNSDDILKAAQLSQRLSKSMGLCSHISEMLKAQQQIRNNFSGISMLTEIAKGLKRQDMISRHSLKAIDSVANTMNLHRLVIPQPTIDAISSINRQHDQLFGNLKNFAGSFKALRPEISKINSLQYAISGISGRLASIAAQQNNWAILDEFEEVTEKAIEFSNNLPEQLDDENQRRFKILLALVVSFISRHKSLGVASLFIIDIFLRLAGIHQYYDFLKDKQQLATKEDVSKIAPKQDSIIHYLNKVSDQLKQFKEYKITNCICNVRLKPKFKTSIISKLPKDFEVIVIQVQHKWVLVNYFDPADGLPQTGWILKKYLNNPK